MGLTAYFVVYDICDPARLREVFKIMKGAGEHVQYSVFRCELTDRSREELISQLAPVLNMREDQVLFIDTGPVRGRGKDCVTYLGRAYQPPERKPIIL